MFDSKTQVSLKLILEDLTNKFSPMLNSIRVPLALLLSERQNKRHSTVDFLVDRISNLQFMLRALFSYKGKSRAFSVEPAKFVFVIDHNREPLIKVFIDLMEKIPDEDICIFTANKSVFRRLKRSEPYNVIYVNTLVNLRFKSIYYCREVMLEILQKDPAASHFDKFSIFAALLKVDAYQALYENLLSSDVKSVVTLCDANLHEQVVSRVANKKLVKTFTLQHGMINALWFPIVSDHFFVWNEHTKVVCQDQYGVDQSKMIVAGNPFFESKTQFKKKSDIFTITYIVTNWGEKENRELFKLFKKISYLDGIRLVVKLRPNPPFKMLAMYKSWMSELEKKKIDVRYKENIGEILDQSNLLVTFHSGVPVDAMAYGVPSVLLDIFEEIRLDELVVHYDDCAVVRNEKDYIDLIVKIVSDDSFYQSLVGETKIARDKYLSNKTKIEAIEFTRSKIVGHIY